MPAFLRSQMRNIAPFVTLIALLVFFGVASPSFATLDNAANILTQISVTGIIAVGLTFVILCAEIDLSIASIANVTGIAVAYFTLQESYVNIANIPLPGWAAILHGDGNFHSGGNFPLHTNVCSSTYSCRPSGPNSRPMPDCLKPPNGAPMSSVYILMP